MRKIQFVYCLAFLLNFGFLSKSEGIDIKNSKAGISPKTVLQAWENMASMVIGTVKLMPAEHFDFSPIEPLASYGGLINHTIGANYLFAATVKLDRPSNTPEVNISDKEDIVKNLEASFDFIRQGIRQLLSKTWKRK